MGAPDHLTSLNPALVESAFDDAVVGLAVFSPANSVLRFNEAYRQFIGYEADEIRCLRLEDVVHPDDIPAELSARKRLLSGVETSYRMQKRYYRKDGALVWADFACRLVRHLDGTPLHFLAQVLDITPQKRAEALLRESEARFHSLCRLSADWLWEQDRDLRFVRYFDHRESGVLSSGKLGNLLGKTRWEYPDMQPLSGTWEEHRALLFTRKPFRDFEFGRIDSDDPLVIASSGEPIFFDNGEFAGYRGASRDVTELYVAKREAKAAAAELERRVWERTRELQQANDELEAFAFSIAHDLRGPLTTLGAFAGLLENAEVDPDKRQHYSGRISANVRMLRTFTDGLLSLGELRRAEMQVATVDLSAIAEEIGADLQMAEPKREVELRIEKPLVVSCDRRMAYTLCSNLLGNAWKYTSRNLVSRIEMGRVEASECPQTFYVRDNGVGFDMTHAHRLFSPFSRLHTTSDFPGTGLGLALVRRVVERHGGRAWAAGQVGEGATFFFSFPTKRFPQPLPSPESAAR